MHANHEPIITIFIGELTVERHLAQRTTFACTPLKLQYPYLKVSKITN